MSYQLILDHKPTHLHAIVTGYNSRENVTRYLEEVRGECVARGYSRVLVEERLKGPHLGMLNIYEIAANQSNRSFGTLQMIAYVDVNADREAMKFAETVAVNRGIPVRVFWSIADAEKWIMHREGGGTESNTPTDGKTA